jgi:hypothetical protein
MSLELRRGTAGAGGERQMVSATGEPERERARSSGEADPAGAGGGDWWSKGEGLGVVGAGVSGEIGW